MWFSKSQEEAIAEFNTNQVSGLTLQEAQARLAKYGENKLKGKPKKGLIALFFAQLQDMLI